MMVGCNNGCTLLECGIVTGVTNAHEFAPVEYHRYYYYRINEMYFYCSSMVELHDHWLAVVSRYVDTLQNFKR